MKKFTRITALFLVLIMLLPSMAQATGLDNDAPPATYADASGAFNDMVIAIASMVREENDEELAKTLAGLTTYLLETQMGFTYIADDGTDRDLFTEDTISEFEYRVKPEYIEEMDYVAGYEICREEGYIRIESEAFDKESGEQFDYLRFEVAQREDSEELMVLFTLHDMNGLMTSSNRYLIYKNGDSVDMLYSRTFGTTLKYRIDLNEWAKGTDYTWSKELLYPAPEA